MLTFARALSLKSFKLFFAVAANFNMNFFQVVNPFSQNSVMYRLTFLMMLTSHQLMDFMSLPWIDGWREQNILEY